jgi:NAD(P)-dependent dehydrogenase (short-subunit alcohol dehydrogenase family)
MYTLNGRVGLVTGGGGGIGRAIAQRLAQDGMAVAVLDRDGGAAQTVAGEIGGLALSADVTQPEEIGRVVDAVLARYSRIDLLVNNAGVAWMGPALETPLEALRSMLAVNVEGVFIASRAVLPHMVERRTGSIVNLASWAGKTGNAYFAGYSASKFAVIGLTQALAREMARMASASTRFARGLSSRRRCAPRSRGSSAATDFPRPPSGKSRSRSGVCRCRMTWRESQPFSPRTNLPI